MTAGSTFLVYVMASLMGLADPIVWFLALIAGLVWRKAFASFVTGAVLATAYSLILIYVIKIWSTGSMTRMGLPPAHSASISDDALWVLFLSRLLAVLAVVLLIRILRYWRRSRRERSYSRLFS